MKQNKIYSAIGLLSFTLISSGVQAWEIVPPPSYKQKEDVKESPVVKVERKKNSKKDFNSNITTTKKSFMSSSIKSNESIKEKSTKESISIKKDVVSEKNITTKQEVLPVFKAKRNNMLSETLNEWANQEGWVLHWSNQKDFRIPADIVVSGKVEDVFKKVSHSLVSEGIDLNISLYNSNKVIVIK